MLSTNILSALTVSARVYRDAGDYYTSEADWSFLAFMLIGGAVVIALCTFFYLWQKDRKYRKASR